MPSTALKTPLNDTEKRILNAAVQCVKQWGIEKTSLNDIAKEAGVTRPTVYSYFANRNEVLTAALLQSAMSFGQRVLAHMQCFEDVSERYIETLLFAIDELPKEPYLAVITRSDLSSYVSQDALHNPQGWELLKMLYRQILQGLPMSDDELFEIAEFSTRVVLSLLMVEGPQTRNRKELRGFLQRRLLPGLPLPTPT